MTTANLPDHRPRLRRRVRFCETCGALVPKHRTDKRFCDWRHDPDLLDGPERSELMAQYPSTKTVTNAS